MRTTLSRSPFLACIFMAFAFSAIASPLTAHAVAPQFTFKGGGWGHAIGMSQYGARGYALQGWKYDAILKHYYQGTKLVTKPGVTIKVNLDAAGNGRSQWRIKAGSEATLTVKQASDTSRLVTLDKTNTYWITTSDGDTSVRKDESYVYTDPNSGGKSIRHRPGAVIRTFSGTCYATAGGMVQMVGTSGPFAHSGVRWRGYIRFVPTSATSSVSKAVNYVDIEKYVYGVVPRESPSTWPAEALKAQAVAARSYAYQDGVAGRTLYCTVRSQVYNGYKGPKGGEVASTNAAVDATKGELVWYGSESQPVKTFFSSCSGGHTADIEDVWTGATAKPYYKGVADADQASPYYTWTHGPYSAEYLSLKVRAKDSGSDGLDYSVASPATIVAITTERASSGHAHHLTLTWSNGKKFRITGDTMRSALGMKSTKFLVIRTFPGAAPVRYQNTDSRIAWHGLWSDTKQIALSSGSMRWSSTKNASSTAAFDGAGVAWIGSRGPSYGKAAVYIDGKYAATVDLYSATAKYKQSLFKRSNLSSSRHTITVKVLRARAGGSGGYGVVIDAFDVSGGTLVTATASRRRFEQTDSTIATLGTWKTYSHASLSGGSQLYSVQPKARLYATFYGSEVQWVAKAGSSYGRGLVSIDGSTPQTVTITSATTQYKKVLFSRIGLSQTRAHTIMIEALGAGSGGTAGYTDVDAIDIRGGWLVPAVLPAMTVQETHSAVEWGGAWGTSGDTRLSGGTHRWSSKAGAAATITFEGTGITWLGKRASWYGTSKLYLDDAYVATVDQYSKTEQFRQHLWTSPRLTSRRHTLRIVATGAHRSGATGSTVGIDAYEITGRPLSR